MYESMLSWPEPFHPAIQHFLFEHALFDRFMASKNRNRKEMYVTIPLYVSARH